MESRATPLGWLSASPNHRDTLLRLAQSTLKLGSILTGEPELQRLSSAIDSSRTLMRTFGMIEAVRSLRASASAAPSLAAVQDCALVVYHPLETWYWLSTHAPRLSRGPAWLSRAICAVLLVYNACAARDLTRRLADLRRAVDEAASAAGAGGAGLRLGEQIEREIARLRLQLRKVCLESILFVHFLLQRPTGGGLRDWQVAIVGLGAAVTALQVQWRAHVAACAQARAQRLKTD
jgi:hypothetical protein